LDTCPNSSLCETLEGGADGCGRKKAGILPAQAIGKVAIATLSSFSLASLHKGFAFVRPFARA
jgi:hypothetical protein